MSTLETWLGVSPVLIYRAITCGAILTYIIDLILDVVLASTYLYDGLIWYGLITLGLTLLPTLLVQIFSVRWHQMDGWMSRPLWAIHALLMGVLHRYYTVICLYSEAFESGDEVDYARFYQQQSDVCMLRLFDSFAESAPQLVFHLYVMIVNNQKWLPEQAAWTGMSAITSMVSLGWGIAAYSSAMRNIRPDKGKMSWSGMITQTLWRAGMLTARIVALVMLALALDQWAVIVLFIHWLVMTSWVVCQDTDFCTNVWEERLYNAIVGIIYCFCFFNLKEGKSRYRASVFYTIIIFENLAFLAVFFWMKPVFEPEQSLAYWLVTSSLAIVLVSMTIGLTSMLIYYRFFHPAGPIRPCIGDSVDFKEDLEELKRAGKLSPAVQQETRQSSSPDFVVYATEAYNKPRRPVNYSRSFKHSCPPLKRSRETSAASQVSPEAELAQAVASISPISTRHYRERAIDCGGHMMPACIGDRVDSAYGTDSNRTGSPQATQQQQANSSGSSGSTAFNNDTYMNSEEAAQVINADKSDDNTYMSVHVQNKNENMVLKRSPVVRDVTSGFAQISSTSQMMQNRRKMTILVPNNLDKTISLEALHPSGNGNAVNMSNHDYENLALININRSTLASNNSKKVSHWRTYSNMADSKHDESSAYERQKYYDIYPLSRQLKEQLYRSLTPLSTAATMASSDHSVASNDTYEPIENYDDTTATVTLIQADGDKLSTRQITSMQSLREVLTIHEKVPMDDPQDRPDLYILAPMRLLSPILEESVATQQPSEDLNKSLMTVISEILMSNNNRTFMSTAQAGPSGVGSHPDGRFADSIESTSSLVHTIDEIRNNSLCNLYYTTTNNDVKTAAAKTSHGTNNAGNNKAAPQVPPRNDENKKRITTIEEEPESPQFQEIQERRRKSALYTSIGSRKNLLELAGTTNHILNTPQKPESMPPLSILDPAKLSTQEFDPSTLKPFANSHSLSPSSKYGSSTDTPTPPLKANQFVRNTNAYRPRRKFSILRDKFEAENGQKPKPMIVAKNKNDLYENISNDFLMLRSNSLRAKAERMAKCKSVPTFNSDLLLRPDEQYKQDGFMRNQWSTASYQKPEISLPNRQCISRRSMSILDDKENYHPPAQATAAAPPPLRPKMKSRLTNGASLSPKSKIFSNNRC